MSVTVEVDTEGSLLTIGQGSREAAGAVQEIVQASGELGVAGLGSDLRGRCSGTARGSGRNCAAKRGLAFAGRR
jgi:hypothetical protein